MLFPFIPLQYTLELATYFSRIGIYILKHVVPRNAYDIIGAIQPARVEEQLKRGEGMVGFIPCFVCGQSAFSSIRINPQIDLPTTSHSYVTAPTESHLQLNTHSLSKSII